MTVTKHCWCSNDQLINFSDDYLVCTACKTLVSKVGLRTEQVQVHNDNQDFYGKEYWLSHQVHDHGLPDIYQRSRQDLPERCLYWLRTLLKYKQPPSKVLELGSSHGGFVALTRWSGFDAIGLELSPWVVDFAHKTFDIPMLLGAVEEQQLQPESFDAIALYDVLEHLPDPVATMQHCSTLLKPDGIFIVQMPAYPEEKSYSDLIAQNDRFLEMMQPIEHVHLFNRRAAQQFFECLGYLELQFEPQLFDYDMFFVASRQPLQLHNQKQVSDRLLATSSGRLVQALLDQTDALHQLQSSHQELYATYKMSEADRAERLKVIEQQGQDIVTLHSSLHHTQTVLNDYQAQLEQSQTQLQQTQEQLQQTQEQLEQTQGQLEQTQGQLEQTQGQLERSQGRTQKLESRLEDVRTRLGKANDTIQTLETRIAAMESSKFWKLRKGWLKVKRTLKMRTDD